MPLPERANLDHLRKQAKDLLRGYRRGDAAALARFREALPAAAGRDDAALAAQELRLHDAQSCLAREHGFASWAELARYVEAQAMSRSDRGQRVLGWATLVYAGELTGTADRAHPRAALRLLAEQPDLVSGDPYLACALGDEVALRQATGADPAWVNRPGGPLALPPLVAVTHSGLLQLPDFRAKLHRCAGLLLAAGADPNQHVPSRWPPASLAAPDPRYRLSALYGAAGKAHDPDLTRLLLEAGAEPNDGESLYHAVEGDLACVRLLLEHGARVTGSNALYRVLDDDNLPALALLLAHGGDPNESVPLGPAGDFGAPLLWAIRRRRSSAHVQALLDAGADPHARTRDGVSAYRLAAQFGLPDVAALLRARGAGEPLSVEEQFVAACTRGDAAQARAIQAERPDLPGALAEQQLRRLPDLAAEGADDAVTLMVALGWPVAVRGGDWNASALNHAVFRGNAGLTRFLLEHGARWTEEHGHGDNAAGTLGWASVNQPVEGGDWAGCARALRDHGMPAGRDPDDPGRVLIAGRPKRYADEVREVLLERTPPGQSKARARRGTD